MNVAREKQLKIYRAMKLRQLVTKLFDGSYEPCTIREVIFEKITQMEEKLKEVPK